MKQDVLQRFCLLWTKNQSFHLDWSIDSSPDSPSTFILSKDTSGLKKHFWLCQSSARVTSEECRCLEELSILTLLLIFSLQSDTDIYFLLCLHQRHFSFSVNFDKWQVLKEWLTTCDWTGWLFCATENERFTNPNSWFEVTKHLKCRPCGFPTMRPLDFFYLPAFWSQAAENNFEWQTLRTNCRHKKKMAANLPSFMSNKQKEADFNQPFSPATWRQI